MQDEQLANLFKAHPHLWYAAGLLAVAFLLSFWWVMRYLRAARLSGKPFFGKVAAIKIPQNDAIFFFVTLLILYLTPEGAFWFYPVTMMGVMYLLKKNGNLKKSLGEGKYPLWKLLVVDAALALVAVTLLMPVSWAVQGIAEQFKTTATEQDPVNMLRHAGSWIDVGWMAFWAIFLAPITEELLFRGLVYPWLKSGMTMKRAMVVTAVIFAASHFHVYSGVQLFLFGLVLVGVYEHTGSLPLCVGLHMMFNAINVTYVLLPLLLR